MMTFSKTIQLFIFDGNPNGRIMCELSNWNGRVYKVSRAELTEFSKRTDAENTGIYFLYGKNENNEDTIYIGESEKIHTRLKQHMNDTEYWNDCIVVISKDNLLNKAHAKFLEFNFFTLAQNSGRTVITNSTTPTCSSVSEYDEAMLFEFINNTKLLVNALGYKTFDDPEENSVKVNNEILYFCITAARGADAKGYIVPDGFAVVKGSRIASSVTSSMSSSLQKLRQSLLDKNLIDSNNIFTKDYIFTSPSLAAAIVMGRNANGRTEWKTLKNKSIKDIEADL